MALSDADRARIKAEQAQAWADGVRKLAEERPSPDPPASRKPNGNGSHHAAETGSWDGPPLPPPEAYESMAEVPRETETDSNPQLEHAAPQYVDWTRLAGRQPPERLWFVQDWLTGGTTLLAGKGGTGKSLLAQTLGTALAIGTNFLGPVTAPLKVLYWACEDDHDELWRRQMCINAYMNTGLDQLERLYLEPRIGQDSTLFTTLHGSAGPTARMSRLREQINDLGASVFILDNIGQTFGANENARHDVTSFVNQLGGLVTGRPFAVLLLGHPSKARDAEYSGSTAWEAAVRTRWFLGPTLPDSKYEPDAETDPDTRYLSKRKANYSAADFLRLRYDFGVLKVQNDSASDRETLAGRGKMLEWAKDSLIEAVRKANEVGERVARGHTSPSYVVNFMRQINVGNDIPKPILNQALTQLIVEGVLVEREAGRYGNRNAYFGLFLRDAPTPESLQTLPK